MQIQKLSLMTFLPFVMGMLGELYTRSAQYLGVIARSLHSLATLKLLAITRYCSSFRLARKWIGRTLNT